jgi:uroporphyrinogen-III synthase
MAKYKVLSTKKLEPSLVEKAKENDIEITEKEFISIQPVWNKETFDAIPGFAKNGRLNIVFTSANAVDVLNRYLVAEYAYPNIEWNLFCLSGRTRQAIDAAAFLQKNILGEANNALALAGKIIDAGVKEVVFFCGNKRREELPATLRQAGVNVYEVVLYETLEKSPTVNDDFDAVVFFSPSGVQSFFSANRLKKEAVCFSIGPTTAASLVTFTRNKIIEGRAPNPSYLIEEVIEYFRQRSIAN